MQVLNRKLLNKPGVTLVELLIALCIFTLLVGLVAVRPRFLNALGVHVAVETLFARCMALQQDALSLHTNCYLHFDPIRNEYTCGTATYSLPRGIEFGFLPGSSGPPSYPQKNITQPITFKNNRIVFHANGIIEPGTVYIIHKESNTMYALSSPIAQFSFLRTYRYNGGWHSI